MKILIIGGTIFLGKHLTEIALQKGHQVTLFNRGKHNPHLFPEVEKIIGDRDGDLKLLKNRQWDAVIDTCGYFPRVVREAAQALKENVGNYTFISSISVYKDTETVGIDESYDVGKIEDETTEKVTGETYGPLKALCEQAVQAVMPDKALIIRPGLIVGPHDPTDRFTYWPLRVDSGGKVLIPGNPNILTQFIDVRDLSKWIITLIEKGITGVYNATGPDYELSLKNFIEFCQQVIPCDCKLIRASDEFLGENEVGHWMELPLWVPEVPEYDGFSRTSIHKALENGLQFMSLEETILDTLEWAKTRPEDYQLRAGLAPEKEAKLIEILESKNKR